MCEEAFKLFVIVLFDVLDFLAHATELADLILYLVLELGHLLSQILSRKFVEHHDVVVSMITEQAFEANRAEAIFAESFDVFSWMNLAFLAEVGQLSAHV